jgi:hypothetical protein
VSYPTDWSPVYSHNGATGTGVGSAIDISCAVVAGYPPVMLVTFTGTATYTIQGSHDNLNWVDFSASLTAAVAKDLVPGVRFWRTKTTANSAAFTSSVGPVPAANGGYARPNVATEFASATF